MSTLTTITSRGATALAVAALLTVAGSPAPAPAKPAVFAGSEPVALRTDGAAVPVLHWTPCPGAPGYECATAEVPLSYRDPAGPRIELAVGRLPARDQQNRLGTIFYNPGGPGVSGRFAPELTPELHQLFDIVGFDPRGVGDSSGLDCSFEPEQGLPPSDSFPVTREQERATIEATTRAVEQCARNAGPLLKHTSTANVARDLDLLRAATGEDQLDYYGLSYGSHLGTVYANLFPERVGAVAIDAVVDPVEWTTGHRTEDAAHPSTFRTGAYGGAQKALRTFLDACAADERCAFREPGTDLLTKYEALLDRLLVRPVAIPRPGGPATEVTYQTVVTRTWRALNGAFASTQLGEFLQQVHEHPQGESSADQTPTTPVPPAPPGNREVQRLSVMCNDGTNPTDPRVWSDFARRADAVGRGFGSHWTYLSLGCATWPGGPDPDRYIGPWNRETAAPVLVIGNRQGDPATSYDDARRTSRLLADARLLTLDSFGHGARGESVCIDQALTAYFTDGTLPAEGAVCEPDRGPFDPVP